MPLTVNGAASRPGKETTMDRLTEINLGGIPIAKEGASHSDTVKHLSDYEGTDLTPKEAKLFSNIFRDVGETYNCGYEYVKNCVLNNSCTAGIPLDRLAEICAAERDGRRVELPCKTGDICYEIDPGHPGIIKHTVIGTTVYNRQADGKRYMTDFVNVITIDTQAVAEDGCEWADQYTAEEWADAPKTRTEAEAALKDAHKPGGEQE